MKSLIKVMEVVSMYDSADILRGLFVNMRRHWSWAPDNDIWVLEDSVTHEPLLIGNREQVLQEYDLRNS